MFNFLSSKLCSFNSRISFSGDAVGWMIFDNYNLPLSSLISYILHKMPPVSFINFYLNVIFNFVFLSACERFVDYSIIFSY